MTTGGSRIARCRSGPYKEPRAGAMLDRREARSTPGSFDEPVESCPRDGAFFHRAWRRHASRGATVATGGRRREAGAGDPRINSLSQARRHAWTRRADASWIAAPRVDLRALTRGPGPAWRGNADTVTQPRRASVP